MHPHHPGPQRHLPPVLADAVKQAKVDTGMTYRELAAEVGVTHPHLVRIAHGTRAPGQWVARRLIEVLQIEPEIVEELLRVAPHTSKHPAEAPDHRLRPEHLGTNAAPEWGDVRKLYSG